MDKILQSISGKRVTITNDGATILKNIPADNPSAKIIVDTSITQDSEVCSILLLFDYLIVLLT